MSAKPAPLSAYELERLRTIRANEAFLAGLNLLGPLNDSSNTDRRQKTTKRRAPSRKAKPKKQAERGSSGRGELVQKMAEDAAREVRPSLP